MEKFSVLWEISSSLLFPGLLVMEKLSILCFYNSKTPYKDFYWWTPLWILEWWLHWLLLLLESLINISLSLFPKSPMFQLQAFIDELCWFPLLLPSSGKPRSNFFSSQVIWQLIWPQTLFLQATLQQSSSLLLLANLTQHPCCNNLGEDAIREKTWIFYPSSPEKICTLCPQRMRSRIWIL